MSSKPVRHYQDAEMWQRWEMDSFDTPTACIAPEVEAQPMPKPAEIYAEIKRLRDTAQLSGHAEGYAAGHAQGREAGIEEGRKAGHDEGYQAGFEAGRNAGRELAQQELAQLQALAASCAEAFYNIENEMGQAMISLAIRIAEQVLRSTLDTHPEKILDLVRDIMNMDGNKEAALKLRVNPSDLDLINEYVQHDISARHWRLVADPSIERGGCLAKTLLGDIDATLQTRWQRVVAVLGHDASSSNPV